MGRPKIEDKSEKKVGSWKLEASILDLLKKISEKEMESQAATIRRLIKEEAKRLKIKTP